MEIYEYEYKKKNERRNKLKIKENAFDWFTNNSLHFGEHENTGTREQTSVDALLFPVPLPTRIFKFQNIDT
jgi:hypothetical protein